MSAFILPAGGAIGAFAYWAFFALLNRVAGGPRG